VVRWCRRRFRPATERSLARARALARRAEEEFRLSLAEGRSVLGTTCDCELVQRVEPSPQLNYAGLQEDQEHLRALELAVPARRVQASPALRVGVVSMARSSVFIASLDGDDEVPVLTTSLTYLESAGPSLTNKLQCCRRAPSVGHEINETWADN